MTMHPSQYRGSIDVPLQMLETLRWCFRLPGERLGAMSLERIDFIARVGGIGALDGMSKGLHLSSLVDDAEERLISRSEQCDLR